VIASQQGVLQTYDMSLGADSSVFSQLDVSSYVTSMALSNYGDYLAFGDAEGQLHIWTTNDLDDRARDESGELKLPPFHYDGGVSIEWPDHAEPSKPFGVEDRTWVSNSRVQGSVLTNSPLNTIGMPEHQEDKLLSNFAKEDLVTVTSPYYNPPEPIPPSVLSTMKMVDFVGYASLPKELRGSRNVVKAAQGAAKRMNGKYARRESAPRFRSDKVRDKADIAAELEEVSHPREPFWF
jgi:PAB-dependent poly(A)-specific ribonuclease subunit 2